MCIRDSYILELPKGSYTLVFSFSGYRTVRKEIELTENMRLDIGLEESPTDLDEVIVSGDKKDANIQGLNIGLEQIQISEINELPTFLGEVDVIKTLLLLPGVNTVGEGASGFNVRGGQTGQNLILFNGATLFNPSHV